MNRIRTGLIFLAVVFFFAAASQSADLPMGDEGAKPVRINAIISERLSAILLPGFTLEGQKLLARMRLNAALEAASRGIEKDVTAVLVGIGAGALFGAIIDGSDGAAKGALIGGAAGVGYVIARRF